MKYFVVIAVLIVLPFVFLSAEPSSYLGDILPNLILEGDDGSSANGEKWYSSVLQDKITLLVYFDPDKKSKADTFLPALEAFERDLDFDQFQIILIVNTKATWIPKVMIKKLLKSQIDKYPKRSYVFDYKSVLVEKWGLIDDEHNILVLNKESKIIYNHTVEWDKEELLTLDSLIRSLVKSR